MNYFAHYFFDHQKDNSYYNAGLVMPDFARVAEGAKRIRIALEFHPVEQELLHQLHLGSKQHYQSDAIFHNSEFFKVNTRLLDELFTKNNFPRQNQRIWFLSHILFELLIDRVLIQQYPQMLKDFYTSLHQTELEVVVQYLQYSQKDGTGRFTKFWKGFIEAQYMQYYVLDDKFIYSLNRILESAKQSHLTKEQETILVDIIEEMEVELKTTIPLLKKELL